MIEDLDGATPEPARRRHVVVLSAALASVSLALFLALLMPRLPEGAEPLAAAPAPSASGGVTLTIASNAMTQFRIDLSQTVVCRDGTRLNPPYFLSVDASSGQMFAVGPYVRTDRAVPVVVRPRPWSPKGDPSDVWEAGWMIVTCATPEPYAPLQ